jgi:hypothetical protein
MLASGRIRNKNEQAERRKNKGRGLGSNSPQSLSSLKNWAWPRHATRCDHKLNAGHRESLTDCFFRSHHTQHRRHPLSLPNNECLLNWIREMLTRKCLMSSRFDFLFEYGIYSSSTSLALQSNDTFMCLVVSKCSKPVWTCIISILF